MSDENKPISKELDKAVRQIQNLQRRDSIRLRLSITGSSLTPDQITEILQLEPDDAVNKAVPITENKKHKMPTNLWAVNSEDHVKESHLEPHLKWVMDLLYDKRLALRKLQKNHANTRIVVHVDSWLRHVEVSLNAEALQRLAQLRLDIQFVIHYQNTDSEY